MAVSKEDKSKQYSRYAAHCLELKAAAKHQDSRTIRHEMATEWLKLADAVLHPLKRWDVIGPRG